MLTHTKDSREKEVQESCRRGGQIRFATPSDANAIYSLGASDETFRVSPVIRFYEKVELEQWALEVETNVLLVSETDGEIVGFLYCKIMSQHWAMLDNFYIRPESRNAALSQALFDFLLSELKRRKISYLTSLVREDHDALRRVLRKKGFIERDRYWWFEFFVP